MNSDSEAIHSKFSIETKHFNAVNLDLWTDSPSITISTLLLVEGVDI
jgi:hypothetical protein